jgi:hypothetical protein
LFLISKLYTILYFSIHPLSGGETKWVLMTEETLSEEETAAVEAETATAEAEASEAATAALGKCTR